MKRNWAWVLGVALLVTAAAHGAEEHPYKTAKVGDWVSYKNTVSLPTGQKMESPMKQVVTAKDETSVTLKVTTEAAGQSYDSEQKIDLTKEWTGVPEMPNAKVEKLEEGKEDAKAGEKSYACNWVKYKISAEVNGVATVNNAKIWTSKDVPLGGLVRMEMATDMDVGGTKMTTQMVMELTGSGKAE